MSRFARHACSCLLGILLLTAGCGTVQTGESSRTAPAPQSENRGLVYGRVLFGNMPGIWTAKVTLRSGGLFGTTYTIWCDTDGLYWLPNVRLAKSWKFMGMDVYRNGQWMKHINFAFTQSGYKASRIEQMQTLILDMQPGEPARVSCSHLEALQHEALLATLANTRLVAWHAIIRQEAGLP